MAIYIGTRKASNVAVGGKVATWAMLNSNIVWPPIDNLGLCFTAVDPGATIALNKVGTPPSASIEYTTDERHWQTYTFNDVVTLASAGDKVYFRATSTNNINFYTDASNYYRFATTSGKRVAASNSVNYLFKRDANIVQLPGNLRCLFQDCTSLTAAPSLPATTLANNCYDYMFQNCTSLTTPPALPATTLAPMCYRGMFNGCTSLATAPTLPATTMTTSCYYSMFKGTAISTPPSLPATTLAAECYYAMFQNCSSLTSAPALPATTMATDCYRAMFNNCTLLVNAPALPATTLATRCYQSMFNGCSSLSYIEVAFDAWGTNNETTGWVTNVAASGTFTCPSTLPQTTGANNIPVGWTVNLDTSPLCFTAKAANSTIRLDKNGNVYPISLETSRNGTTWTDYGWADSTGNTITLTNIGDKVYFRAKNENSDFTYNISGSYQFKMSGTIAASGNIQSLLKADCSRTDVPAYCYNLLFAGCSSLTTAPKLPATTLGEGCYHGMFSNCTSLTTAPYLQSTAIAKLCYGYMFAGCSSLTTPPTLPATTLAEACYEEMFKLCTSLTIAPQLPATTLAKNCYHEMFYECTSLTYAPSLPATTLADYCYRGMFYRCRGLTTAPSLPATTLAQYCYDSMFNACTALTTPPTLPATTLADYCYSLMFGACTSLTSAPVLPATTLASSCYDSMFYGCSRLSSIKLGYTGNFDVKFTDWVSGVASSGTFYYNGSDRTRGASAIPSNWTITTF